MAATKYRALPVIWTVICVSILACAGIAAVAYFGQRSLMYFPDRSRVVPSLNWIRGLTEVSLTTADGETIIAWTVAPQPGKPVILYFHGNGGNFAYGRVERFRELTSDGSGLFAISYRGYGGSSGTPSEAGLHLDANAAYDAAAARYGADRLVGYGESLGTGVVTQLAARKPLKAVALEAPFTSTVSVARTLFPWLPVSLLMRDQYRSDLAIKAIKAPLLILHGDKDNVIPVNEGRALFELANEPKQFKRITGAGHNDLYAFGAGEAVRAFFEEAVEQMSSH